MKTPRAHGTLTATVMAIGVLVASTLVPGVHAQQAAPQQWMATGQYHCLFQWDGREWANPQNCHLAPAAAPQTAPQQAYWASDNCLYQWIGQQFVKTQCRGVPVAKSNAELIAELNQTLLKISAAQAQQAQQTGAPTPAPNGSTIGGWALPDSPHPTVGHEGWLNTSGATSGSNTGLEDANRGWQNGAGNTRGIQNGIDKTASGTQIQIYGPAISDRQR